MVPNVPAAAFEACASLLAAIAQRQLSRLPPGFHTFWGLPVLDHPPSQPLLEFAAAALQSGTVVVAGPFPLDAALRWSYYASPFLTYKMRGWAPTPSNCWPLIRAVQEPGR